MGRKPDHPRNQHYVPQFLLRNFTGEKEKLFVFEKPTGRVFPTSPKNVAAEAWFYDFVDRNGVTASFEQLLGTLETSAAFILNGVIAKKSLAHLTPADRNTVSFFAAVQQLRVQAVRDRLASLYSDVRNVLIGRGIDPGNSMRAEIDQAQLKRASLQELVGAKDTKKYFATKLWVLLRAPEGTCFQISDNPVVLDNQLCQDEPGKSNVGLGVPGVEIYLPISREYCLNMLCPSWYVAGKTQLNNAAEQEPELGMVPSSLSRTKALIDAIEQGSPYPFRPQNVDRLNCLQLASAARFVFSATDDFELAKRLLKEHPRMMEPPRLTVC